MNPMDGGEQLDAAYDGFNANLTLRIQEQKSEDGQVAEVPQWWFSLFVDSFLPPISMLTSMLS